MSDKLEKAIDNSSKLKRKLEAFADILDDLSTTEDKKKLLWKEVYENALVDRENAGMLFTDAWSRMGTGSSEHATLGSTLTKYLERMSKFLGWSSLCQKPKSVKIELSPRIFSQTSATIEVSDDIE